MRTLKTSEAAALLNVSPNTLRAWERRFGYPKPQRSAGHHRLYTFGEVVALRDALQEGLSISSAVSRARESLSADTGALTGALSDYQTGRADAAMEAAIALRSVERSIDEVLLPSLEYIRDRHGAESAPWAFSASWARDWLLRAQRLSLPPSRSSAILIGDANAHDLELDSLALRSLELFCRRAGARVLVLPVTAVDGLGGVLEAFRPDSLVIAGGCASDDEVAQWAYRIRLLAGTLPVSMFRRASRNGRITAAAVLDDSPGAAHRAALAQLDGVPRSANSSTASRIEEMALDGSHHTSQWAEV
jgi:DNA-binding transcriptional MerR regulator